MIKKLLLIPIFLLCVIISFAQKRNNSKETISFNQELYGSIKYRLVGPFRGGRAGTVSGVVGNRNLYYMGTAGGGVWKTEDAGNTWKSTSDGYFGGSIGAVAVSESDPNIIYVGEGEQTLRGNVSSGKGMWRSNDAGETWNNGIGTTFILQSDPNGYVTYPIGKFMVRNTDAAGNISGSTTNVSEINILQRIIINGDTATLIR